MHLREHILIVDDEEGFGPNAQGRIQAALPNVKVDWVQSSRAAKRNLTQRAEGGYVTRLVASRWRPGW